MAQMTATELGIPCEVKMTLQRWIFGILEASAADAEEILKALWPYVSLGFR